MSAFIYKKSGRIAYLTINRPEAYNAMNSEVWDGLVQAWVDVGDDSDIWVAIVTGAGDKAFCAGQDLKEMARWMSTPKDTRPPLPIPDISPMRGLKVWKPFIAAINGICTGGGLELAMACDIRIASTNAQLGLAEVKQSLVAGNSGTQKLIRLVPFGRAVEMLITGDFVNANEAHQIGLVNKVVQLADLMPTCEALAGRICKNGPLAVRAAKELAYRGIDLSLEDGLHLEHEIGERLFDTEDALEGPKAFAEKRAPVWKAR